MTILYAVLLVFIIVLIWRINHPGDLRLNKRFVGRYVQDLQGRGPTQVKVTRLRIGAIAPNQVEDRAHYSLETGFADGSKRLLLAEIVYPLEQLQRERDKNSRPGMDEMMPDPMNSATMGNRGDYLEKLREDPFKDLSKEEQVIAARAEQLAAEVEGLKRLNNIGVLFPRLIAHDAKQMITLTEGIGSKRLDDLLQQRDRAGRVELLRPVIADLATFHQRGKTIAGYFPPGAGHSDKKIKTELQNSLSAWDKVGATVSQDDFVQVMDLSEPLLETSEAEKGLRLVDSSPRAYFMQGNRAGRANWDGVRTDVSAFDVIELVCDPAVALTAAEEVGLFKHYLQCRELPEAEREDYERQMLRLAVYFRLVLLGYLAHYRVAKVAQPDAGIKYWTPGSIAGASKNLLEMMSMEPGLSGLLDKLRGPLTLMSELK
ncbi:MAG: hypothetical protein ACOX2K_08980 [Bacillota bacterium]